MQVIRATWMAVIAETSKRVSQAKFDPSQIVRKNANEKSLALIDEWFYVKNMVQI